MHQIPVFILTQIALAHEYWRATIGRARPLSDSPSCCMPRGGNSLAPKDAATVLKRAPTRKKLDALIALLVKKRLITESELMAEIRR